MSQGCFFVFFLATVSRALGALASRPEQPDRALGSRAAAGPRTPKRRGKTTPKTVFVLKQKKGTHTQLKPPQIVALVQLYKTLTFIFVPFGPIVQLSS